MIRRYLKYMPVYHNIHSYNLVNINTRNEQYGSNFVNYRLNQCCPRLLFSFLESYDRKKQCENIDECFVEIDSLFSVINVLSACILYIFKFNTAHYLISVYSFKIIFVHTEKILTVLHTYMYHI